LQQKIASGPKVSAIERSHCSYICSNIDIYRKQQKLSERKVSWLTGFNPNVGKTFVAFFASSAWKILKKAVANMIYQNLKNQVTFFLLNLLFTVDVVNMHACDPSFDLLEFLA